MRLVALILLAVALALPANPSLAEVTGRPRIIDGDTIEIGRQRIRLYHVPGGQYYKRTKITSSKGERWFCSEAEAQAAGWRRSKR